MGKSTKASAYSMFVDSEFKRLKKSGQSVEYRSMFSRVGHIWEKMDDDEREPYKLMADAKNNGQYLSYQQCLSRCQRQTQNIDSNSNSKQIEIRQQTHCDTRQSDDDWPNLQDLPYQDDYFDTRTAVQSQPLPAIKNEPYGESSSSSANAQSIEARRVNDHTQTEETHIQRSTNLSSRRTGPTSVSDPPMSPEDEWTEWQSRSRASDDSNSRKRSWTHSEQNSTTDSYPKSNDDYDASRAKPQPPGIPKYKKLKKQMEKDGKNVPLNVPIEEIYDEFYPYYLRARDIVNDRSCDQLINDVMYSFSANVMCGTEDDIYLPLEISIAACSIERGLIKPPYHCFINPGYIPVGAAGHAKEHLSEHKIPLPPNQLPQARTDYTQIYREMLDYVGEQRVLLSYSEYHIRQDIGVLRWLYLQTKASKLEEDSNGLPDFDLLDNQELELPDPSSWTVLCIADYVYSIARRLSIRSRSVSYIIADNLLNNDGLVFADRALCDFHNVQETKWCTRFMAVKSFLLLKHLLKSFKTEFKNQRAHIEAPPQIPKIEPSTSGLQQPASSGSRTKN